MDFAEGGRHLIIDGVVTTVYINTVLQKVTAIPGFAAKHAEDKKFKAGADSSHPVAAHHGGHHRFIPFAMEDGDKIGVHAHAALRMLAEYAVAKGKLPPMSSRAAPLRHHEAVAMWVRRWQQKLSV
jgi:hypothetical protein